MDESLHSNPPARPLPPDVLLTKLHIPTPRANLVARPRLVNQLDHILTRPLTLISAPPGFGKSTLLAAWIPTQRARVAWVSLDQADNDPARFLSYTVLALDANVAGIAENVLPLLQAPQPSPQAALPLIINECAKLSDPVVLVLDDYHVIDAKPIHDGIAFLLAHLPPHLHLVIATRQDPPLALAQLRARDQLLELRAADLRFTRDEAAAFLNQAMGLNLTARDITVLEERTEGWIAGLQLAALSMQGRADRAAFIAAFQGSHRYIADYLAEQVLAQQSTRAQNFLLHTCILERMNGALCDAVTIDDDSETTLRQLDQSNLFLIALDDERRWYRYHHLFADVLRARLAHLEPTRAVELHQRASEWFAQNGFTTEAIEHALSAKDYVRAADLIQENTDAYLRRIAPDTLLKWLDPLPTDLVHARPRLILARAWAFLFKHQLERAEQNVAEVDETLEPLRGEIFALRAGIAYEREEWARGIELGERALTHLSPERLRLRADLLVRLGAMYSWQGQGADALRVFQEAERLTQEGNDPHTTLLALFNQGGLAFWRGELTRAASAHQRALELAHARGLGAVPIVGFIHLDIGELHYNLNELELAETHLQDALTRAEQLRLTRLSALTQPYLARLEYARGKLSDARARLEQANEFARQHKLPARYAAPLAALRARMLLHANNLDGAAQWMDACGVTMQDEPAFLLTPIHAAYIRVAAARGEADSALLFLRRVYALMEQDGWVTKQIEFLILEAVIESARGNPERALASLERALTLAAPLGLARLFLDEGQAMKLLLQKRKAQGGRSAEFIGKLTSAFGMERKSERVPTHSSLIESLSDRELQVLRLIADGLSNQEIAKKLYLSVGTVKVHLKHIYSKLDVNSRTQAVARARELNLL